MNKYYYYTIGTLKDKIIRIVYCVTNDIIITTNLKSRNVKIHFNDTTLPQDCKEIIYEDYLRLLTYYNCIS